MRRLCHALGLALALSAGPAALAAPLYLADISDPVGDVVAGEPDIVAARVRVEGGVVHFSTRFAPGTLDPATVLAGHGLDIDQDSGTGEAWGGLGLEFSIWQGLLGNNGTAYLYSSASASIVASAPVTISVLASQVDYAFDLSLLGGDEGLMDVAVHVQTAVSATRATFIQDYVFGSTVAAEVPEPPALALWSLAALAGWSVRGLRRSRARPPAR